MRVSHHPIHRGDLFNVTWSLAAIDKLAALIRAGNDAVALSRVFETTPQAIRDVVARNAAYLPTLKG